MADVRHRTTLGNRFRFLVRFLGLTGVLAAAVGATLLSTGPTLLPAAPEPLTAEAAGTWLTAAGETLYSAVASDGDALTRVSAGLLLGGLAAVLLWLLVEVFSALFLVTGRRTAVGTNTYLQIALAAVLVVILNAWSFSHYRRWDVTRDQQFTLPEQVREKLQRLDPSRPTDVVVLQLHKTAGGGEKPDALDFAAERKVVEKVRDLVDQLRELGPRFRVSVLDVEEEGYEARLEALTKDAPELRAAIDAAPENSIFFRGGKGVQRMSFSEFLLLDKAASVQEIDTPAGKRKQATNLVLIPQGVAAFARKVEEVEEKRPKVGLLVIHPELSTRESSDDYSSGGLRRTLEANGFEVVDVLVKQWGGRGGPTPSASTFEENEFDRTERRFNYLSSQLAGLETLVRELGELQKTVDTTPVEKLAADRRFRAMIRGILTTEAQKQELAAQLRRIREDYAEGVRILTDELNEVGPKYRELAKNDRAVEGRRVTDVKAKLSAAVADCDLLVVPRLTTIDLAKGYVIRPSFFTLPQDHADVVQGFLTAGKPVLALFGPMAFGTPQMDAEADPIEKLLGRVGIEFGSQTVLTDKEGRAAAERQGESLGSAVDLPSFAVVAKTGDKGKPNPIAAALLTSGRATGVGLKLGKSGPRPVYVPDSVSARQGFPAAFLFTAKEAWNESRPLPDEDYMPKYEPAKPDDPKKGTRDEERRGPFPIGAAVEVPAAAFDPKALAAQAAAVAGGLTGVTAAGLDASAFSKEKGGPTVRIVAYGHGGLFTGRKLDANQEQLLLHTLNWQLKRQDRLPTDRPADETWKYPRADLSPRQATLWHLGTFLGLPLLCGYLGLLVLMTRKVR